MRFTTVTAVVFVLIVAIFAAPAFAGGWAVTELDEALPELSAGEPVNVGFTVLQHGKTPVVTGEIGLWLRDTSGSVEIFFPGVGDSEPGHYVATVIAPTAGAWVLEAQQGTIPGSDFEFEPYPLGTVQAVGHSAAAAASQPEPPSPAAASSSIDVRLIGLVGLVGGIASVVVFGSVWMRRPSRATETARTGV